MTSDGTVALWVNSLPTPVREWIASILQRQAQFERARRDNDRVEVRMVMERDGTIKKMDIRIR